MSIPIAMLSAVLACIVFAIAGYSNGKEAGSNAANLKCESDKLQRANEYASELQQARKKSEVLQASADRLRKEKANEIKRIAIGYQSAIDGLRDRAETRAGPGGLPEAPSDGAGCTGAGLARPDAGFIAGYAADVARLQAEFDLCRKASAKAASELSKSE